jgi:surface antigen
MIKLTAWAVIAATCANLAACETTADGSMRFSSTGKGVIGGALVGSLACIAAGGRRDTCIAAAIAGGLAGGLIGSRIDARDKERREAALRAAMANERAWAAPSAAAQTTWSNPVTGNTGSVRPIRAFVQQNRQCREIEEIYVRQGEPISEKRQVCLNADGQWR